MDRGEARLGPRCPCPCEPHPGGERWPDGRRLPTPGRLGMAHRATPLGQGPHQGGLVEELMSHPDRSGRGTVSPNNTRGCLSTVAWTIPLAAKPRPTPGYHHCSRRFGQKAVGGGRYAGGSFGMGEDEGDAQLGGRAHLLKVGPSARYSEEEVCSSRSEPFTTRRATDSDIG